MMATKASRKKDNNNNNDDETLSKPKLIATFSLPFPITSICLDPADRVCYLGTNDGCFSLDLFYSLKGNKKIINLIQASGEDDKTRIFSLVENSLQEQQDATALYSMGQLLMQRIADLHVTKLEISMDGTILIIGDSMGRVSITEIFSKQILKTLQSLTTGQVSNGPVTNILHDIQFNDNKNQLVGITSKSSSAHSSNALKIPSLQRVIYDKNEHGQLHDIWFQVGETVNSGEISNPLSNFDQYLDNLKSQEFIFTKSTGMVSDVKVELPSTAQDKKIIVDESSKDKEISELKDNVEALTNAYKELRTMHEKLYEEHEQLTKK